MKTIALIASLLFMASPTLVAQEQLHEDYKDFKILIEKTSDGVKLTSIMGSGWMDISFDLDKNTEQAIDEYGMTRLDKVSPKKDSNLTDYLFTITRTKDGIVLNGLEGTLWKELTLSLSKNESQAINQYGMSD